MPARSRAWVAPLAGGLLGALFFVWIGGARVIVPSEIAWTIQGDWRVHFLGWHFFRHEPWHLPPGRIDGYMVPLGTSLAFTDSIPLVAFAIKPFAALLPASFQYLGAWLCLCFALQGVFAVLLVRLWTRSITQQLLGALCFVLLPTLLMRTLHPALCAHWVLLWALWLYLRSEHPPRRSLAPAGALGLIAGLIHPYLAFMTLGLLGALGLRQLVQRHAWGVATIVVSGGGVLAGWWLSGLFTLESAESLQAGWLGVVSMNLLAVVTPTGWSTMLPELPIGAEGQAWEGFQYLGVGVLLLLLIAAVVRLAAPRIPRTRVLWPLVMVASLFAFYALSPRVTFGSTVVLDYMSPLVVRLGVFRATGRFFWPAAYLMLAMALGVIVTRVTPRKATAILCAALVLQLVDLRDVHALRRRTWQQASFHAWQPSLSSPAWQRILPNYAHMTVYPPIYCGGPPSDLESLAYTAGLYGLTLNSGLVARYDEPRRQAACMDLDRTLLRGDVDDTQLYVGRPGQIERLKTLATQPVVCGVIDAVGVCATTRSYQPWRDAAHLE